MVNLSAPTRAGTHCIFCKAFSLCLDFLLSDLFQDTCLLLFEDVCPLRQNLIFLANISNTWSCQLNILTLTTDAKTCWRHFTIAVSLTSDSRYLLLLSVGWHCCWWEIIATKAFLGTERMSVLASRVVSNWVTACSDTCPLFWSCVTTCLIAYSSKLHNCSIFLSFAFDSIFRGNLRKDSDGSENVTALEGTSMPTPKDKCWAFSITHGAKSNWA